MNIETALRKLLFNPEKSFTDNVQFCVKAWNSIELEMASKYDVIIQEFTKKLPKSIEVADSAGCMEMWEVVNQFLSLEYNSSVLSSSSKYKLIDSIKAIAESMIDEIKNETTLQGLIIVLEHSAFQNAFRGQIDSYIKYLDVVFTYISSLIERSDSTKTIYEKCVKAMDHLQDHVKHTPHLQQFRKLIGTRLLKSLTATSIQFAKTYPEIQKKYSAIVNALYFGDDYLPVTLKYLKAESLPEDDQNIMESLFNDCDYIQLMTIECFLLNTKHDLAVLETFLLYSFTKSQLSSRYGLKKLAYILYVYRKHDIPMGFDIQGERSTVFLGNQIAKIFADNDAKWKETNLVSVLTLLCSTLQLNPMILEEYIFDILVQCMVIRKDEYSQLKYEEFLSLVIEMYKKLSRAEKFVSNIIKKLSDYLAAVPLPKKINKRKSVKAQDESDDSSSKRLKVSEGSERNTSNSDDGYLLEKLFEDLNEWKSSLSDNKTCRNFTDIQFAWPSNVGQSFVSFIETLVSKPSLVIWKTLVFGLEEQIELLYKGDSDANNLFMLEFICALFSQYMSGSRLAEQMINLRSQIEEIMLHTRKVLNKFALAILKVEHNRRTLNSFLIACISFGNFEQMLWFYSPDIGNDREREEFIRNRLKKIHSYLSVDEWNSIEQRIVNFGQDECKINLSRLIMQRMKAKDLEGESFDETKPMKIIKIPESVFTNHNVAYDLLLDATTTPWIITKFTNDEKTSIINLIMQDYFNSDNQKAIDYFNVNLKNALLSAEFVELISIEIQKRILQNFKNKKTIIKILNRDDLINNEDNLKWIAAQLTVNPDNLNNTLKKLDENELLKLHKVMESLSNGFIDSSVKIGIVLCQLNILKDLLASNNTELIQSTIMLIKNQIDHCEAPDIFKYIELKVFLNTFPLIPLIRPLYDSIFNKILRKVIPSNSKALEDLTKLLETEAEEKSPSYAILKLCSQYCDKIKNHRKIFDAFKHTMWNGIKKYFKAEKRIELEDKEFVRDTINGFCIIVNALLIARDENIVTIDEEFVRICKLYMGYSIDCTNEASIKYVNIAFHHKNIILISDAEIDLILNMYWKELIKLIQLPNELNETNIKGLVKIIFENKSDQELHNLLNLLNEKSMKDLNFLKRAIRIFAIIPTCSLTVPKRKIFLHHIQRLLIFAYESTIPQAKLDVKMVSLVIRCYMPTINSVQTPVSIEFINDILTMLTELVANVNKNGKDLTATDFQSLMKDIIELCQALIKHRLTFIKDQIISYLDILKEVLKSICWYRSDRKDSEELSSIEISFLIDLAHKYELIINILTKHAAEWKRYAPYYLEFVISMMISNSPTRKSATIYSKVKGHIQNVCYDVISVCDHRTEGFILRTSNDASKRVYETLVKEFKLNYKFKGKI